MDDILNDEEDANSDDDVSIRDGGSELNSEIGDDEDEDDDDDGGEDDDDTLMGSEDDVMSEDEGDVSGSDNDDVKSVGESKGQKRKFADFDEQLDSANQSLRALKRLAGAKLEENNDTSDVTDGILSNEDFQRIKELKVSFVFYHTKYYSVFHANYNIQFVKIGKEGSETCID